MADSAQDTEDRYAGIIDALGARGWAAIPGFFTASLIRALGDDLLRSAQNSALNAAGTGRPDTNSPDANRDSPIGTQPVRTDRILWLTGEGQTQRDYLAVMDDLRLAINRSLYLGLFDYEGHYAVYPPGGYYKKHIDSLQGARNRIVSCVTYLTEGWNAADEGALVLYDHADAEKEMTHILPMAGTLALFLSEEIPHEVLPPARERRSIAGWFRCNASSAQRADPLR